MRNTTMLNCVCAGHISISKTLKWCGGRRGNGQRTVLEIRYIYVAYYITFYNLSTQTFRDLLRKHQVGHCSKTTDFPFKS